MLSQKVFLDWFKKEVEARWKTHHFEWIEIGDWNWRLAEFDIDTLTQAVRQHKACECYPMPNLKKVYEYACKITAAKKPPSQRSGEGKKSSGVPEAHTFIMCVAKGDNGCGCMGWFVPILIWPFHKTYTAEMMDRRMKLRGTKPLDLNQLRKRYKIPCG